MVVGCRAVEGGMACRAVCDSQMNRLATSIARPVIHVLELARLAFMGLSSLVTKSSQLRLLFSKLP